MASWFVSNWFNVLSAIGVIASLLFTGVSLRSETKNRRVSNLIALTQNHRDLWTEVFCHRSDQKGPPRVENGPF